MTYAEAVAFLSTYNANRLRAIAWKLDRGDHRITEENGYTAAYMKRVLRATHEAFMQDPDGYPQDDLKKLAEALEVFQVSSRQSTS